VREIVTIMLATFFCLTLQSRAPAGASETARPWEGLRTMKTLADAYKLDDQAESGKVHERIAAADSGIEDSSAVSTATGGLLLCGELLQNFDFEQGMPPLSTAWSAFKARVPPTIGTDPDGNRFIRITATRAEGGAGGHAGRVRSQASLGQTSAAEGETVIYQFALRLGDNAPKSAILWQLFSYGSGKQLGYATPGDGTDPTVWLYKDDDETFTVSNFYNEATQKQILDIGTLPTNEFVHITVRVHWSLDPAKGRVDVWVNGQPAGTLTGKPTIISPLTKPRAETHIGTYGGNNYEAVGSVDFDDVVIVREPAGNDCITSKPTAPRLIGVSPIPGP